MIICCFTRGFAMFPMSSAWQENLLYVRINMFHRYRWNSPHTWRIPQVRWRRIFMILGLWILFLGLHTFYMINFMRFLLLSQILNHLFKKKDFFLPMFLDLLGGHDSIQGRWSQSEFASKFACLLFNLIPLKMPFHFLPEHNIWAIIFHWWRCCCKIMLLSIHLHKSAIKRAHLKALKYSN